MGRAGEIIMSFLIQRQALDAASKGGVVPVAIVVDYVFLLIASIVGLAVIIERFIRLRRDRLLDDEFAAALEASVRDNKIDEACTLCDTNKTVLAAALAPELKEYKEGNIDIEEAIEAAGEEVDDKLNANLDILSTVARIAPLLGLLGTVLGMMHSFSQLDAAVRKETLAQGITAALDTTVRGLFIAILCLTFERAIHGRVAKSAKEMSAVFTRMTRLARKTKSGN